MERKMCDECGKKPAVCKIESLINGIASQKYLCEDCQYKYINAKPMFADFGKILKAFGNPMLSQGETYVKSHTCPKCGCNINEYLESGYLGCPDCYNAFNGVIMQSVRKMQKDVRHTGKTPRKEYSADEQKYNDLLKKREEAVAKEDFILAGEINEQMKQLNQKIKKAKGGTE